MIFTPYVQYLPIDNWKCYCIGLFYVPVHFPAGNTLTAYAESPGIEQQFCVGIKKEI